LDAHGSGEDHLTEFIAAALAVGCTFCQAYLALTLGSHFGSVVLTGIETQVPYPQTRCKPDMRASLRDSCGKSLTVLIEHKISAAETQARLTQAQVEREERELVGQLERYAALPDIDALLYFRRSPKAPSAAVLSHPKYIRPSGLPHFLWEDLYPLLKNCESESLVIRWLREGFEELGFLPPPADIGYLSDLDAAIRVRNRRAFRRRLEPAYDLLTRRGWMTIKTDQYGNELRAEGHPTSPAGRITITGDNDGRFTIRVVPKPGADIPGLAALLRRAYTREPAYRRIRETEGTLKASGTRALVLEFNSLAAILLHMAPGAISDRLVSLIAPVVEALSST
jgi:hypothetical protein